MYYKSCGLVFYCWVTDEHIFDGSKRYAFVTLRFLWARSLGTAELGSLLRAS